jgi:hypothetical protein
LPDRAHQVIDPALFDAASCLNGYWPHCLLQIRYNRAVFAGNRNRQAKELQQPTDACKGDPGMTDLVLLQLTDPFRIGLIIALVVTMLRTAAVTGRVLPLVLGIVFVAVILPTTMPSSTASMGDSILAGLFSNLIITVPVLAVALVLRRHRR